MASHLHHVHIFASELDYSMAFYQRVFGAEVILDREFAGARNVFMTIGEGRLHLYDQPPRQLERGGIHHFGIQTDELEAIPGRLTAFGIVPDKGIRDYGVWRYLMVPAPDHILVEVFEVDRSQMPSSLTDYFF